MALILWLDKPFPRYDYERINKQFRTNEENYIFFQSNETSNFFFGSLIIVIRVATWKFFFRNFKFLKYNSNSQERREEMSFDDLRRK